ncbi:MAG: type II toxin-antitoxin system RelE/ParE family toxin [Actinobacteria bacterium]|nr:type II toxin-antitoxin system RelE/ParE family toxin [Actinomycetota bacterium]
MSYDVRVEPAVDEDVGDLVREDRGAARAALSLMLALRDDPWLGEELRERYNLRPLKDCRRIRFDRDDWQGKPRYRLVYRNEPEDGAPGVVRVWSLGPRQGLIAYSRAAARITRERARGHRRR